MIPRTLIVGGRTGEQGAWVSEKEGEGKGRWGGGWGEETRSVFFAHSLALHQNAWPKSRDNHVHRHLWFRRHWQCVWFRRWSFVILGTGITNGSARDSGLAFRSKQSENVFNFLPPPLISPHLPFPSSSFSLAHPPCLPVPLTINVPAMKGRFSFLFLFLFLFFCLIPTMSTCRRSCRCTLVSLSISILIINYYF